MQPLCKQYRPRSWSEIVGQDKVVRRIEGLRRRGIGGRAYWISGQSGTGKSSIAWLLAREIAEDLGIDEIDAQDCTPSRITELERTFQTKVLGSKGGRAIVVNEAHALRKDAIRKLLVVLERLPSHVLVIFTTTCEGQESLFEEHIDADPLLSRCLELPLSRRGLAEPFARRAHEIAAAE